MTSRPAIRSSSWWLTICTGVTSRRARALLFALRRMQADRVLALVTARPGELSRLGEGWSRFASGDPRAARLRLDGLDAGELAVMALEARCR